MQAVSVCTSCRKAEVDFSRTEAVSDESEFALLRRLRVDHEQPRVELSGHHDANI